jgi:hypothetical protein
VIVHIDMTVRPPLVAEILNRLPPRVRVVNRTITDIRKRQMGQFLKRFGFAPPEIDSTAPPETPVFVKSNLNSGDASNRMYDYMLLRDVPPKVWKDPDATVQRFLEEPLAGLPGCRRMRRAMIVAGDVIWQEYFGMTPKIKGATCLTWHYTRDIRHIQRDVELLGFEGTRTAGFCYYDAGERTRAIADRIEALARDIGMDFGAIDTISPDPEHTYVLDVNTTPLQRGLSPAIKEIFADALARHVAASTAPQDGGG